MSNLTYTLRIDPDGTCTRDARLSGARDLALVGADSLDVISLRAPFLRESFASNELVAYIDDWGRTKGLPLNRKAWALYGRSPVYGPVWVKDDHDAILSPKLIALIESADFPSDEVGELMDQWLAANEHAS